MTAEDRLTQALRDLAARIDLDLAAAEEHVRDVGDVLRSLALPPSRGDLARVAIDLDHYYTSIESTMEAAARTFDDALPTGSGWHRALLAQVSAPSPVRPSLLAVSTCAGLGDLLRFRHFLRHAYAVQLEWDKMRDLATALAALHAQIAHDFRAFREHVDACLAE